MGMQQKAPVSRPGLAESSVLIDRDGAGVDEVTGLALFVDLDFGEQPLLLPVFPQLFYVGKGWIGYAEHIQVFVKQAMTADFGQHLGHMGTLLEQGGQIQDSHVELNERCTKNRQIFRATTAMQRVGEYGSSDHKKPRSVDRGWLVIRYQLMDMARASMK